MKSLEEIFAHLGLKKSNGLFYLQGSEWQTETSFPNRVKRLIERKIKPDAFFCFDNKPMVMFFSDPQERTTLHEEIWNFNECPIVIIFKQGTVEIFNGFKYEKERKSLEKLGDAQRLNDFTYFELVTGRTWEQYQEHLTYKNRVDYHLLQNIKAARSVLLNNDENRAKLVNALLGKVIFVRYLIDRKVKMRFDGRLRTWTNAEFCELLDNPKKVERFFEYLEDKEKGFNGDLFPISSGEFKKVRKSDYQVLKKLLLGHDIAADQRSLFELYDFSIIPIEFISNVYELFIGQDNQKKEGAYYTPLFLVDYILKETVDKKLNAENPSNSCKVFDPACGSGIFLVETLRKIIEKFIADTGIDLKEEREKFKTAIKNLAQENIYGIDKDLSAVQVAIFSIYLTLLDYLEPPGIETFKFPILFNKNFFQADFFDESNRFNDQFKKIQFDFILGNPPWKGNGMDETGNTYLKNRKNKEKTLRKKFDIAINNNEIAEGFVLRTSDFCNKQTRIALIIRSSSLYNLGYNREDYSPFRQYLLEEYFIDKVFELAAVRHEVFEKSNQPAIAPASVIFYRYANGKNTNDHLIHHISLKPSRFFSLFKVFTINRTDYKQVQQKKLKEFDWLWKVLVYGSYLDFNFIKRLKEGYTPIREIISDEKNFVEGTGIQYSSNPTYNSRHLIGNHFIDSYGLTSFFILPEKISSFKKLKVHRIRDERLFKHPMLLIREGIDMETLTARCAISKRDLLFKDSITSIKALKSSNINVLNNIAAVFSTSLFSYYAVTTFASIGIERERVKNYNKYSLPYLELNVKNNIEKIEITNRAIHAEKNKTSIDDHKIQSLQGIVNTELKNINEAILKHLELNEVESSLIDYTLQINRNLIVGTDESKDKLFSALIFKEDLLKDYAQLYLKRFQSSLSNKDRKFIVEIWHTQQLIGMFFKVLPIKEHTTDIVWIDKQNSDWEILALLTKISSEKITDKLFIQKDVRGFEKDYFYIFKPNERRLWHKAIGYLDVNEFADAILKAGREGK